jgi:hypothetical protein
MVFKIDRRDLTNRVGLGHVCGKVRTNDDKRRAVLRMLTDPEWRQWPLRKIEKHCGVSIGLVQKLHKELSVHDEQMRKPASREGVRGGTTYEMDTSRIDGGCNRPEGPGLMARDDHATGGDVGRSVGASTTSYASAATVAMSSVSIRLRYGLASAGCRSAR